MTRAVRNKIWTTISMVLIAAGFCVFSYRWYTGNPIANTIQTVNVGAGSSITIRNLTGYCNDVDPDVISSLERAASNGKIIAVSAPCRDLGALKTGSVAGLQKYIVWFVGWTDSGSPLKLPADTTQSDFANEIANATAKVDFAEVASDVAKNGLKVGIIRQGLVDREVHAVYLGSILAGDNGGTVKIIPCVTGIAAIHHLVVTINAYDEFRGSATFSELLSSVKLLMHAALSDNSEDQCDARLNHDSRPHSVEFADVNHQNLTTIGYRNYRRYKMLQNDSAEDARYCWAFFNTYTETCTFSHLTEIKPIKQRPFRNSQTT